MTKTKTCPNQNTIQKNGPPRKTQFIKFRVTPEEKRELEIMCEILHVNISTLIRRSLHSQSIKQTIVVTGGGEDALSILSDLLGQCGKIGSNLNQLARHFNSGGKDSEQIRAQLLTEFQLARHFNSGGKDSEQIRAQLLTELSALTLFRLDAEKKIGELYGNHQAYKLEELRSNSA